MAKTFSWIFAALFASLLAACGGGEDIVNDQSIPAGAKVCELKQVPAGSLIPRADVYNYTALMKPELLAAGDDLFVADYGFSPGSSLIRTENLIVYVQQWSYRATPETLLWECTVSDLAPGSYVAIRGGPRGEKGHFNISVRSHLKLTDGKIASSVWSEYTIVY